jgi:hypothetical protein
MSQHDFDIANQTASASRADLNLGLKALASQSSGSTTPATTYANMKWYDTDTNILKQRSEADDAWIDLGTFNQGANTFSANVDLPTLDSSVWETGTSTDNAVISPAKLAAGIAALAGVASPFAVQVFTASGTYTPTTNAVSALVIITGGGAGAGDNTGEAGGAGATAIKLITGATFAAITTSTITIGSGGNGNGANGSDGGTSSWSDGTTTLTALGGDVGSLANREATGGDINISGSSGGGSFWGSGGGQSFPNDAPDGGYSFTYGGGGGIPGSTSGDGGNGMSGVVYILEFGG